MLMGRDQIPCHKDINRLVAKCHGSIHAHQIFQLLTAISGLLLQLPVSALDLRLIGIIQLSGWNLQRLAVQCIAELTYHQKLPVIRNRHNCRRTVMMNEIPVGFMSVSNHCVLVNF